jgi:HSP20 family protein
MQFARSPRDQGILTAFQRQVQRLFGDFFGEEGLAANGGPWAPEMDLAETPEALLATAEVPGIDPQDLEITVQDNRLVLHGEKKEEKETKGKHWIRTERRVGSFHREVSLPVQVEEDRVEAVYKNGVVTVTLPKKREARGKQVPVKSA